MNKTFVIIAVVAVIAIVGCFLPVGKPVVQQIAQNVGATSGSALDGGCLTDPSGGHLCSYKVPMRAATTSLCVIPLPAATSTIVNAFARITVATGTASAITIATSSNWYATSTSKTLLTDHVVAANAQDVLSIDPAAGNSGPSTYLLFHTAGPGLGGYTYTGDCDATVQY